MLRMPPTWRQRFLLIALATVVILVASTLPPRNNVGTDMSPPAKNQVPKKPDVALNLDALLARNLPPLNPSLFGLPTFVPTTDITDAPPPLPSEPTPPSMPYTYLGQYLDADGESIYYLKRDEQLILSKPGTQLDIDYKLETDVSHGLVITYMPLKTSQTLLIGNFAP